MARRGRFEGSQIGTRKSKLRIAVTKLATLVAAGYNKDAMWQLCKEFLLFLRQEKKWWLIPLIIILVILGAIIVFSSGSVLAPLMYPFM